MIRGALWGVSSLINVFETIWHLEIVKLRLLISLKCSYEARELKVTREIAFPAKNAARMLNVKTKILKKLKDTGRS